METEPQVTYQATSTRGVWKWRGAGNCFVSTFDVRIHHKSEDPGLGFALSFSVIVCLFSCMAIINSAALKRELCYFDVVRYSPI